MENSGDHRGDGDGGSHLSASVNTAKVQRVEFHGVSKGKSALMIFDRHANRHFWSRGYFVSTVGLNEATIAKYVREQEKQDQMMDRITTNEVEDPFRLYKNYLHRGGPPWQKS